MVDSSELLTIAEIFVAFAGFTALVSVLGRRYASADPRMDAFRLQILVEVSLIGVVASFVPIALVKLGAAHQDAWRTAAAVLLTLLATASAATLMRQRKLSSLFTHADKITAWASWFITLASNALLLTIVFGFAPAVNGGLYFSSLLASVLLAGIMFLRVAGSLLSESEHA